MATLTVAASAPAVQKSNPAPTSPNATALIEVKDVKRYYGSIRALDGISFAVQHGEFVCLVGASGAGKSTLMRLFIREEKPSAGKIIVAGRDIRMLGDADIPYYRRKIGVVFQDYKLLPQKTVQENVAFALEICDVDDATIRERVPKVLELVGLQKMATRYPRELSGGEQQRTSIARALVHNPKILLADEPTGNLDPQSSDDIVGVLQKINQSGTLVLLASHNKNIVDKIRKRVILLRDGKLISDQAQGRYVL